MAAASVIRLRQPRCWTCGVRTSLRMTTIIDGKRVELFPCCAGCAINPPPPDTWPGPPKGIIERVFISHVAVGFWLTWCAFFTGHAVWWMVHFLQALPHEFTTTDLAQATLHGLLAIINLCLVGFWWQRRKQLRRKGSDQA